MEQRRSLSRSWIVLAALSIVGASAQTLTPSNSSTENVVDGAMGTVGLQISMGNDIVPLAPVTSLTSGGAKNIPPSGLSGPAILADASNYLSIVSADVTFVSCDPYVGEIQAPTVFNAAYQKNVTGIVLYSQYSDYCTLDDFSGSYSRIYTMKSHNDTTRLLDEFQSASGQVHAELGAAALSANGTGSPPDTGNGSGGGANEGDGDGGIPGPAPSTAVAMIILYSITGIITALFLVIIVTGAVRAHRHPERYGPRNVIGRSRQSRARGLARAMLDTLPIVKVGDEREAKPTDVELAESRATPEEQTNERRTEWGADVMAAAGVDGTTQSPQTTTTQNQISDSPDVGIAAATNGDSAEANNLGCSICTEDFVAGEDQRVLPCDHRFHPACVDPWLLNVSGTCPLCRIDLRPANARTSADLDENGEPVLREGEFDPPPLDGLATTEQQQQRMSIRRSIMIGIMGLGGGSGMRNPSRMTRQERVLALREMRAQEISRMRRESAIAAAAEPTQGSEEDESSTRQRLRRVFGIRTRRTGQQSQQDEEGEQ